MDATLFNHSISIDRTQILPTSSDEFSYNWGRKLAAQQVRAAGIYGSRVFNIADNLVGGTTWLSVGEIHINFRVTLPSWFGTTKPPMIFAFPQYGSVVTYKQFQDDGRRDGQVWMDRAIFRTWIDGIRLDDSLGTSWEFWVRHISSPIAITGLLPSNALQYIPPYGANGLITPENGQVTQVAVHWYALGVDPNL